MMPNPFTKLYWLVSGLTLLFFVWWCPLCKGPHNLSKCPRWINYKE